MTTTATDFLDQLSTSQTSPQELAALGVNRQTIRETQSAIEEAEDAQAKTCDNRAPFIFFIDASGRGRLVQGCCNAWECRRCGVLRAKEEYGRMVHGARSLQSEGHSLYFATVTCRGGAMSLSEAEQSYGSWSNGLLTNMRTRCKRSKKAWFYACVTERQKRQFPHSHLIMTWAPEDAYPIARGELKPNGAYAKNECLYSQWFVDANVSAGLGPMCDYSEIRSPIAVAVYLGKYLFKDAMRTTWPKNWRRVRYSNSWPKLPDRAPEVAFPLVHYSDWLRMEALGITVYADSEITLEAAYTRWVTCVKLASNGTMSIGPT